MAKLGKLSYRSDRAFNFKLVMKLALLMRPSGVQTEQSDKVKFKLGVPFTLLMIKDELVHLG